MSRFLGYTGAPILIDDLLAKPDGSLFKQVSDPAVQDSLCPAGFGMIAWDPTSHEPDHPFTLHTTSMPALDRNLKNLATKLRATCLLAHVRASPLTSEADISLKNVHPFRYDGFSLSLAHNGNLASFNEMRYELLEHIRPDIALRIQGTTDSEWIYAILMTQLGDVQRRHKPMDLFCAIQRTLTTLRRVRERLRISEASPTNLLLTDGENIMATRFTFDFGCYGSQVNSPGSVSYTGLWYTIGQDYGLHDQEWKMVGNSANADSVIVSSEPLPRGASTWIEVPEYFALYVTKERGQLRVRSLELDV